MFSLLSVNVVYIALSAAKLVFFGHGIDNIVTLASAVHSHLARIRRQNRQRPQPCTWRLDKTRHCLSCISVSVIGAFSQLELDTNSGSIKEREFPTVNRYDLLRLMGAPDELGTWRENLWMSHNQCHILISKFFSYCLELP